MAEERQLRKADVLRQTLEKRELLFAKRRKAENERHRRKQKKLKAVAGYHNGAGAWIYDIPEAPTFYPTIEEFEDPYRFIRKIQAEGSRWGICKVVPPVTPAAPPALVMQSMAQKKKFTFTTRHQTVKQPEWDSFEVGRFMQSGRSTTLQDFQKMADEFQTTVFGSSACQPAKIVEAEYWRQYLEGQGLSVEYGNDVEGTAFAPHHSKDPLGSSKWNLQVLPTLEQSALRLLSSDIPGVTSPMLYVGMLFATFAWHVEDQYLYSINYQHMGAAKTWYGVPASDADGFEEVAQRFVYSKAVQAAAAAGKSPEEVTAAAHTALLGKTTMICPKLLMDNGVKVSRAVQNPGEFIITFPRGYHGGFSNGFNLGEAANFATADWFRFGAEAVLRYSRLKRPPMLAQERLLCLEAEQIKEKLDSGHGSKDEAVIFREYVAFVTQQAESIRRAQQLGAEVKVKTGYSSKLGIPCDFCGHICLLAHAVINQRKDICCLRCALSEKHHRLAKCDEVLCHPKMDSFKALAEELEQKIRQGRAPESSLRAEGLTERNWLEGEPAGMRSCSSQEPSDSSLVDGEGRSIHRKGPKQVGPVVCGGAAVQEQLRPCKRQKTEQHKLSAAADKRRKSPAIEGLKRLDSAVVCLEEARDAAPVLQASVSLQKCGKDAPIEVDKLEDPDEPEISDCEPEGNIAAEEDATATEELLPGESPAPLSKEETVAKQNFTVCDHGGSQQHNAQHLQLQPTSDGSSAEAAKAIEAAPHKEKGTLAPAAPLQAKPKTSKKAPKTRREQVEGLNVAWAASLDLDGTDFARAASTRSGSFKAIIERHTRSWQRKELAGCSDRVTRCRSL